MSVKCKIFIVLLSVSLFSFSQVEFEKGYIVDLKGNRIEVYIKNEDWSPNPTQFNYKTSLESSEVKTGRLNNINEFGIGDYTKYVKATVEMDQSSNQPGSLSAKEEPEFMTQTVFLKQLVEGDANLYMFYNSKILRFFYRKTSKEYKPLVYKKYLAENNLTVKENKSYKKELFDNLSCETISLEEAKLLEYTSNSLSQYFTNYNLCNSNSSISYIENVSKGDFNFGVKLGFFSSRLKIDYDSSVLGFVDNFSADLGSKGSFRIGVEAEYVLPANKSKWAIFIEPAYQLYSASRDIVVTESLNPDLDQTVSIDYSYIDLPIGVRYYMFLSDQSKMFINAGAVTSINFTKEIEYSKSINRNINSEINFMFGLGYVFDDRFSLEARVNTPRDLTTGTSFNSNYTSVGIVFGYRIL